MYRKAVTVNPGSALGHYLHGFILDEMERREEASRQYERVLKTRDPSPQADWVRRQATRLIEREIDRAIRGQLSQVTYDDSRSNHRPCS
jgi:hypothetical protein